MNSKLKLFVLLFLALTAGTVAQAYFMLRMPIDEYHENSMELEEALKEND